MPEQPAKLTRQKKMVSRIKEDERIVRPPSDATPTDPSGHLRWVRGTPDRIAQAKHDMGYTLADEADVKDGHGGYKIDGEIRKGDLVLMKTTRDRVEEVELRRRRSVADMDSRADEIDEAQGLEEFRGHKPRRGKGYNIPIDLK